MANKFQIKRTSTSGVTPNTTNSGNTAYIDAGELAINMADSKLFTANTTGGLLELGSNLTSLTVGSIYANGTIGSTGKVLTTNGSGVYWGDASAAASTLSAELDVYTFTISSNTTVIEGTSDEATTLSYSAGLESVFINGSRQISGVDYAVTNASAITLTSNVIAGDVVQVTTFNATSAEQATYTYTVSSNTIVFEGADDEALTLQYVAGLESVFINGSRQIAGVDYNTTNATAFTLTSNAVAGDVVQLITWTDITNTTNTDLVYVWTNTHTFYSQLTVNNNLFISGGGDLVISSAGVGGATVNTTFYNDASDLYINVNNAVRGYFASNGNFGLANTTPAHRLSVGGDIFYTGALYANGATGTKDQILYSNGTGQYWENQQLRSSGQQVIDANTNLGSGNFGTHILAVTGGITITLPSSSDITSGTAITIKNAAAANITISYAFAGDGQTTLQQDQSATWFADGSSSTFWRQYALSTNA